jgi:RNA polymerase sigma-70 factor (ECF subfamily)
MGKLQRNADEPAARDEPAPESVLLDGLRRGDPHAAREFYDRYAERLYRFVFHALGGTSRADAEDLLQETFMALAEALPYFRGDCSLMTFACAIARRRVASFVRGKMRRANLAELSAAAEGASADPVPSRPGEDTAQAAAALAGLSIEHREVLLLKYVEEMSVSEIASVLRLSEHAVESRLARARRALARKLGADS